MNNLYGLIGFQLSHSFSKGYFTEKFKAENIQNSAYQLFELNSIAEFPELLRAHPNLHGLNVTIPYKEAIIPFLDRLDPAAAAIGAVNVVKFEHGALVGYNSDYLGFMQSLQKFYPCHPQSKALVLGTGGAAKAVLAALKHLHISYTLVSREKRPGMITYQELTPAQMAAATLIVNTSPVGTYPNVQEAPAIPYELLSAQHYLYDLVYNPPVTEFMKRGQAMGAKTINGYEMLCLQAEAAWQIWNS
ncbi:shikimate dehydrogenase [Nibribacter ruber]|uniref:Shikimate dehydrogenase n=1 Tax=Nibribacter ruber TaxID=2698458 RepID=A0A6P1P2N5_9BACT|nr:shikimate dehydrogenase [Nibribacter ruber]QHL88667.1 shikimate dehydrogenase [Nibribacter ruber]